MVQYNWEILSLYTVPSVDGLNNVVNRITWRYQAKEGSYAGDIYKDTYLDSPNLNQFIIFDKLTEETIVGWIKNVEDMDEINAEVLSKLDKIKNPLIVEKRVPWDSEIIYDTRQFYVLVANNEIVYGPKHWHSDLMNDCLEKAGLDRSLPMDILARKQGIVPSNVPTIINNSTKVYRALIQNEQPENSIFTNNGHINWDFSTGVAIGTYVAVDKTIDEIKTILKFLVSQKIYNKEVDGIKITMGENIFEIMVGTALRGSSPILLVEKYNFMGDNDIYKLKVKNNMWAELTKTELASVISSVHARNDELVNWEYNLNQAISACSSIDALKNLKID